MDDQVLQFEKSILAAAAEMVKDNALSRFDFLRLKLRLRMPSVRAEMYSAASMEVMAHSGLASPQAIDWDKVFEFLKWLIPILLDLFT
jgi:hypothetical protein